MRQNKHYWLFYLLLEAVVWKLVEWDLVCMLSLLLWLKSCYGLKGNVVNTLIQEFIINKIEILTV